MPSLKSICSRSSVRVTALIAFLVIAIAAAASVIQSERTRQEDLVVERSGRGETMYLSKLRHVDLEDVSTGQAFRFQEESKQHYRLLVFLSAADCSSCMQELPMWNAALKDVPKDRLSAYLIFVNSTPSEIAQSMKAYPTRFTVLSDQQGKIASQVHLPETPVTVLQDGTFRLRMALGSTNDFDALKSFVDATKAIITGNS